MVPEALAVATGRPALQSPLVLIVEDHPDIRDSMRVILDFLGFRVAAAADGAEGVEKALVLRPAVALVDIGLPVLDGYQVARRMRAALGPGILLVACTAYDDPEVRALARAAGFDRHIAKPVNWGDLTSWLEEVTRGA